MKTILITGASQGIGKALANKFLEEDYAVLGTSLNGELDYSHENLTALRLDVTNEKEVSEVAKFLKKKNIPLNILVNNAGVLIDEDDDTVDIQRLKDTLEVNLFGAIKVTQGVLPFIKSGGHVINISSSAGQLTREVTSERYPGYKISKTALNMYTVTLAKRLESENIKVSSVHPGWVKTDMGGEDADITPKIAADYIYDFAQKDTETGGFWFNSERMEW